MKLQLFSDLHLETVSSANYSLRVMDSDAIILAGDIHIGLFGIDWAAEIAEKHQKPVIYIAGNHEYYRREYYKLTQELREFADSVDNLYFLEKNSIELLGVRLLGTTLWTNYRAEYGDSEKKKYQQYAAQITDHRLIKFRDKLFTPEDAFQLHLESIRWLSDELDKPFDGKTIVITHHAPSLKCVHPYYGMDNISPAFISDLEDYVLKVDLWCYGHTHANLDMRIGNCRLVSNQRGYREERLPVKFDSSLVIEV
ncbi:metallophosphoesterase [Methylophaga sulfidovorans]|uniref:Predicted phosphohydrolase n=1 Tax=Methylophaga sulfidovorans TaxID=45496 RepID=A0A1I4AD45_9GAMM|nr:metallophosphoesterase [Methylophaga sulfidovorans]SFK54203.1 Predicted phosphohydrolase [Methylophaga sulfidovorans]